MLKKFNAFGAGAAFIGVCNSVMGGDALMATALALLMAGNLLMACER